MSKSVQKLKEECKILSLKSDGKKQELVDRIITYHSKSKIHEQGFLKLVQSVRFKGDAETTNFYKKGFNSLDLFDISCFIRPVIPMK